MSTLFSKAAMGTSTFEHHRKHMLLSAKPTYAYVRPVKRLLFVTRLWFSFSFGSRFSFYFMSELWGDLCINTAYKTQQIFDIVTKDVRGFFEEHGIRSVNLCKAFL